AAARLSFLLFSDDTPTPDICSLSLHDALPISLVVVLEGVRLRPGQLAVQLRSAVVRLSGAAEEHVLAWRRRREDLLVVIARAKRSEEHTSELQSLTNLRCRLLL